MNKWPRRVIYISVAIFWCLVFFVLGGFSLRQSAVLGPALAFVVWVVVFVHEQTKPRNRFIPYYVRVAPNWYQILNDFKLIGSPEEWRSIHESVGQLSMAEHCVLRDGLFFTVLQVSHDFRYIQIFWNRQHAFTSKVDSAYALRPVLLSRKDESLKLLIKKAERFSVQDIQQLSLLEEPGEKFEFLLLDPAKELHEIHFFMKPGTEGYDLGISIPDWWWQKVKESCPQPEKQDLDRATGYVKLVLARISHREWDLYWEPEPWDYDFHFKTVPQIRDRRDGFRQKLGWKTVVQPDIPEMNIDWPEEIEHKYFRLEHRAV